MLAIRPLERDDWEVVASVLAEGIATGRATFETAVPSWEEWDAEHVGEHRLVAEVDGEVVGWTAAAPYSRRAAYCGVLDESVYVAERVRGRGVGRALLEALVASARSAGAWTLQASVFPENEASLRLHRSVGFREVAVRERLGRLGDEWRDVVLLELRL